MKQYIMALGAVMFATAASAQEYATVTNVQPNYVTMTESVPERSCRSVDVPIYGQSQSFNQDSAILGGIVGGIIGNQIGKGDGNKIATGVGAMTGAIVGGKRTQQEVVGYRQEQRCSTTYRQEQYQKLKNYKVRYEWNGVYGTTYTYNNYNVGDQIPVVVSINAR